MKLVSINAHLSNSDEENRTYTLEGNVRVDGNTVSVESGTVVSADGGYLGSFSDYSGNLSITYQTAEGRPAILSEVEDFIGSAKAFAEDNFQI